MNRGVSIAKWNDHVANEDSFFSSDTCIAVSDGAGGCGLFADEWSQYLIEQLPKNKPITSFTELDEWVDSIWESFYNEHEEKQKKVMVSFCINIIMRGLAPPLLLHG